jgi:hypothetical protein
LANSTERPKTTRKKAPASSGVSADAIAYRAFELFAARGWEHGHDVEDWLRAERELAGATPPKRRIVRKSTRAD